MAAKSAAMPTAASPALPPLLALLRVLPAKGYHRRGSSVPAKSSPSRRPDGRQSRSESSQRGRAELLPPASQRLVVPSAVQLPAAESRRARGADTGSPRGAGHPAGSWLVSPRLVFQLIALGTGGTMPGCSPRSRLPARSFFPNHFPGPKCWSQDPAAAPLGMRGDNGGLLITASLPFLLNIIPLQTFCRQEPHRPGREGERSLGKVGACPQASQGARGDTGASPSPPRKVCSKTLLTPDPGGARRPAAPWGAPSSHLLQKLGGFPPFFLPCFTTFGWFLGSHQITPPHSTPALSSELIIMPGYCLLTILRHCKLISPWLIFSRVTLKSNLLQFPRACPLPSPSGVCCLQPPRATL